MDEKISNFDCIYFQKIAENVIVAAQNLNFCYLFFVPISITYSFSSVEDRKG